MHVTQPEISLANRKRNHAIALVEETSLPPVSSATQSPVIAMVKVVDTESGESKLVLNDEAVAVIRDIKGPISVIAIAGAYR